MREEAKYKGKKTIKVKIYKSKIWPNEAGNERKG